MNRIDEKFQELKSAGKKALITFVTAGDPDIATTVNLIKEMEKRGADIIELGIPYSDPIAEGPVIQAANKRALDKGIKIRDIMSAVKEIRKTVKAPLLYLLYYNCIFKYGPDAFFRDCAEVGIDGVIIPDLPCEERGEIEEFTEKYGIVNIVLVSPVSNERVGNVVKDAGGFIYCVSSLGVTGVRNDFKTDFDEFFSYINSATAVPKAIGFGISAPAHVEMLKGYCDGLIIGSAVVRLIAESSSPDEAVADVGRYTGELRAALDR